MYYPTEFNEVKWFSKRCYSKNYICKFMQINSWHHELFHFNCPFEFAKWGKEGKKIQKFKYLEKEKSFSNEI